MAKARARAPAGNLSAGAAAMRLKRPTSVRPMAETSKKVLKTTTRAGTAPILSEAECVSLFAQPSTQPFATSTSSRGRGENQTAHRIVDEHIALIERHLLHRALLVDLRQDQPGEHGSPLARGVETSLLIAEPSGNLPRPLQAAGTCGARHVIDVGQGKGRKEDRLGQVRAHRRGRARHRASPA